MNHADINRRANIIEAIKGMKTGAFGARKELEQIRLTPLRPSPFAAAPAGGRLRGCRGSGRADGLTSYWPPWAIRRSR